MRVSRRLYFVRPRKQERSVTSATRAKKNCIKYEVRTAQATLISDYIEFKCSPQNHEPVNARSSLTQLPSRKRALSHTCRRQIESCKVRFRPKSYRHLTNQLPLSPRDMTLAKTLLPSAKTILPTQHIITSNPPITTIQNAHIPEWI